MSVSTIRNSQMTCPLAAAVAAVGLTLAACATQAQVGVEIGPPPLCPYGYYDYAPYPCAPYGYYGPDWFVNGLFIGVGPWFHGHEHFRGLVNHRLDVRRGYRGPLPERGERPLESNRLDRMERFSGTEMRDGRGNAFAFAGHEGGREGGERR